MRIYRKPAKPRDIFHSEVLEPSEDHERERKALATLPHAGPKSHQEPVGVVAFSEVDISRRSQTIEEALGAIEKKALTVLAQVGLRKQVREYLRAKNAPHKRTALVARLRPEQPPSRVEGETVDALRALSLLLRLRRELDRWQPYEDRTYRALNARPVPIARWQANQIIHGVADVALELGVVAMRLRVWRAKRARDRATSYLHRGVPAESRDRLSTARGDEIRKDAQSLLKKGMSKRAAAEQLAARWHLTPETIRKKI